MSKKCTLWEWQATTTPLSTPPKHCTVDVNHPRVIEIGDSASIAAGVTIGNNVVIGANTLINKDVPDNRVVVGNSRRVVSGIDSYLQKRRAAQLDEAAGLYGCWRGTPLKVSGGGCCRKTFSPSSSGFSSQGQEAPSANLRLRRSWPCAAHAS